MSEDEQMLEAMLKNNEGSRLIASFMVEKKLSITVLFINAVLRSLCTPEKREQIAVEMKDILLPSPSSTILPPVVNHYTYNFYGSMPKEKVVDVTQKEEKKAIEVENPKIVSIPLAPQKRTFSSSPTLDEDEE